MNEADLNARITMNETQIAKLSDVVESVNKALTSLIIGQEKVYTAIDVIREVLSEQKDAHKEFREGTGKIWDAVENIRLDQASHKSDIDKCIELRSWIIWALGIAAGAVILAITNLVIK